MGLKERIKGHVLLVHETKRSVLMKFIAVVAIFITYLAVMSFEYGLNDGVMISLLTWSFFVFCTPIADAGFLVDFPVRMLTGLRMFYSEVLVWVIAASLNIYAFMSIPLVYEKTFILGIFRQIITNPIPYWLIIFLSAIGTFFSVYFGDELIDVSRHRHRKKYHAHKGKHRHVIVFFVIIVITLIAYNMLLSNLGIHI